MTDLANAAGAHRARNAKRLFDGTVGVLITLVAIDFLMMLKVPPSAMHLIPVALALPLAYVAFRAWKASAPLRSNPSVPDADIDGRERANLAVATLSAGMARSSGGVGMANAARAARANEANGDSG